MNRRNFLVSAAAAGGAAQLPASASDKTPVAPSDRIRIGLIGCGGMGRMDMADFQKQPEVEIAACCDVDRHALERALSDAQKKTAGYGDYRKLLERRTSMRWSSPPRTTGIRSSRWKRAIAGKTSMSKSQLVWLCGRAA